MEGGVGGRSEEEGRFEVGLCSRGVVDEWGGRVGGGGAHGGPYPLSCFMATALNCAWTSTTASRRSEPSDLGRKMPRLRRRKEGRRGRGGAGGAVVPFARGEVLYRLVVHHLSSTAWNAVPQSRRVQHIGSQTRLGSGVPMVPVGKEEEH